MPFPDIDPLIETFLEPTRIFLFGKPFPTLKYDPDPMSSGTGATGTASSTVEFEPYTVPASSGSVRSGTQAGLPMPPGRVEQALRQVEDEGIFARIYGFSYEGHYYKLPRPVLFLVRGEGRSQPPEEVGSGGASAFSTRFVGVEGKDWQFGSDIRVWAVDKHDIAICLDLEVGSYDQVLLQPVTAEPEESPFRTRAASGTTAASRTRASFRGAAVGPHQDR
jgi:hypothetical protein